MLYARTLTAALCIGLLPLTALAERGGNGKSNGNGGNRAERSQSAGNNGNRGNRDTAQSAQRGNSAAARANPSRGFCPPGLQRKDTACVPPGQAAAGVTAAEWAEEKGYTFYPGASLDGVDYAALPNYADYGLPDPQPGETYAVVNSIAVVIDPASNTFLRVATR